MLPFAVVGSTRFLDVEVLGVPGAVVPDDDRPPSVAEIGSTWYAASAQRTALDTEVELLLLGHASDVWQVLRVTLGTDARNIRSEGIRRAHTHGRRRDDPRQRLLLDPAGRVARRARRPPAPAGTNRRSRSDRTCSQRVIYG
ncbi:GNAT family N-acetyltransferase [Blastococcus litoris]|uniref:GNAT family N-acetyltransferase n=1 Tax=Blastococcus litoris TaxID=2171622 RepID=UPI0019CFAFB2|nr:GNAT family protein [Blastococcus litoris]